MIVCLHTNKFRNFVLRHKRKVVAPYSCAVCMFWSLQKIDVYVPNGASLTPSVRSSGPLLPASANDACLDT